jgi:hypothetical protein
MSEIGDPSLAKSLGDMIACDLCSISMTSNLYEFQHVAQISLAAVEFLI